MAKNSDIICQCYVNLTDALKKYKDNWMCDMTWVRVFSARYPNFINAILASHARPSIVPSLGMLFNVEPRMLWVYSFINSKFHVHMTQGNGGRCHFFIDKWLESPQQLLLDHMIARMCMLGPGRLGYQHRIAR